MNRQQIFDKVVDHLLAQQEKSVSCYQKGISAMCAYRGTEGRKCALGCLIADEFYSPELEGATPSENKIRDALTNSLRITDEKFYTLSTLFHRLQHIHDSFEPESWEGLLKNAAKDFGLQWKGA